MKKLVCCLTLNGTKYSTENHLLRMFKNLQKCSNKNSKNSLKLSIILTMQIFKINALTKNKQKNRIFSGLYKNKNRTFFSIKFLVQAIKKEQLGVFYKKFYKEILSILKNDSFLYTKIKILQKQVLFKKNLFSYYR